ncbi:MAG: TldD/PmbA family protein [Chloroflexi bacterium]|nr:TldD/PmbA family protein [Chloroflexota bacterium]
MLRAVQGHPADHVELRVEESGSTQLNYRNERLEDASLNAGRGGCIRALVKGGWAFGSFNDLTRLRDSVAAVVQRAHMVARERSDYAEITPVEELVSFPSPAKDLRHVPLSRKKELLDEYNRIILKTPGVASSSISYADIARRVILATSEGSLIEQARQDVVLRLVAVARDGVEVQQAGLSLGSREDFAPIEGYHSKVREMAERAVQLLKSPRAKGAEYTVVLDPILAGVFVHEAFGHLSEADFVYEDKRMQEIMVLGRKFGGKHLNIVDDPTMPGLRGSYKYDDEGTPARKSYLIREGVLVGRLHSRETAAKMGEQPSGHARAINYRFPPIVRMSNTYIEQGTYSLEEMLSGIKEGVYARNWYGGTTSMEMFTFSSGDAYMIRNGKIAEPLRPVTLSGNLFDTLGQIDAIGNDLEMNQGGGCGKGGQAPLPVSNGGPHIRIKRCLVGGK